MLSGWLPLQSWGFFLIIFGGLLGCARCWLWNGWGVNLSTFFEEGEGGEGKCGAPSLAPRCRRAQNPPILPVCPLSQPQIPSNSEYRQERLSRGVVRCKIIVEGSKIFAKKGDLLSGFLLHLLRICRLIWARRNYERLLDEMCFDGQMCLASVL